MCGIFGVSLKQKRNEHIARMAMTKVKLLGLYNQSRGRDSCGIAIDDKIIKGVDKLKHFDDFVENIVLPFPKKDYVVIGHTRASTRGANTDENAHPFLIKDDLIGVHNGRIENIDALLTKYELKPSDYKVDSHGLYALIEQEGVGVLNEYVGNAALAFRYKAEPDTLYLYHGASKQFKNGELIEERPLFVLETKEGIYFSSLDEALAAIREDEKDEIYVLNHNMVFQIRNGEFTENRVIIEREEKNIAYTLRAKAGNAGRAARTPWNSSNFTGSTIQDSNGANAAGTEKAFEAIVLTESLPKKMVTTGCHENQVYFHWGRYWRNKRHLLEGCYHITDKGIIVTPEEATSDTPMLYFYRGVMIVDGYNYSQLMEIVANPNSLLTNLKRNFAANISRFSKYPVTNLVDEATDMDDWFKAAWYFGDGKRYDDTFTPKFSSRHYTVVNGLLTKVASAEKENTLMTNRYTSILEVKQFEGGGVDVSGGASDVAPFLHNKNSSVARSLPGFSNRLHATSSKFNEAGEDNSDDAPEDDNAGWWYEIKFKDHDAAMQVIGDAETEALRAYIRGLLEQDDDSIDADDREVEMGVCDIIMTAVNYGVPILQLCPTVEDEYRLKSAYQKMIDQINEQNYMEDVVSKSNKGYDPDDYADEVTKIMVDAETNFHEEEQNVTAGDRDAILKDQVENMELMLMDAEKLADNTTDDLSQELAKAMYIGIDKMQANLASITEKFKLHEMSQKIKGLNRRKVEE